MHAVELDLLVIGVGYVGLPLAQEAVRAGLNVAGLDVDPGRVARLNASRSPVDDISDDDLGRMIAAGFEAGTDPTVAGRAGAVVICVPTPLSDEGGPDLSAVVSATESIAPHLRPGTLVVLESTTYPGTTEEIVQPILERSGLRVGTDLHLAFSPERIDPGNREFGVRNTPKVVGGVTPACRDRAAALYARFVDQVVTAKGTREAETAKLLENTYRHVNIALVNEMARFCRELGIDIWDVIRCASTKPFGFEAFRPGPGVGGHCIPIDPNYLSYKVRSSLGYPFRFVELAQEINAAMPGYVVQRAQDVLNDEGLPLRGSRILLLGVSYKPGISDDRETPARPIARLLARRGAIVGYHDNHVKAFAVDDVEVQRETDLDAALPDADLVILLQADPAYSADRVLPLARRVLDTRGVLGPPAATL